MSYLGENIGFGLVTYQWGRDWDLPTLIANCTQAGVGAVELRTTHAHGVEPKLDRAARDEVRRRFEDSPVRCLGPGSNENFDSPDPEKLKAAIATTEVFLRLSHDIGGTGVKVKPDSFHDGVPHEQTIDQIGKALAQLGDHAMGLGQEIRLEVHGQCSELPTIAKIMEVADHPQAVVCWNSNPQDLTGAGLEANFEFVKEKLGKTVHARDLGGDAYPYPDLIGLLVAADYDGYVLIEASSEPEDRVIALTEQREIFEKLLREARVAAL
ncbi:hypothetical protein BH23VER1_BH23VER1_01760 [soil metagenome]